MKDFFSKCDQIHSFLWIWSYLLKKFSIENFIFCAVVFLQLLLVCKAKPLDTERKLIVYETSWTSFERLIYSQFTFCVQGENDSMFSEFSGD